MGIAGDVAVSGKDEEEYDANLHNLTKIAQQEYLVFNYDKCDIKKQKMRLFGLESCSQGVNPDPAADPEICSALARIPWDRDIHCPICSKSVAAYSQRAS